MAPFLAMINFVCITKTLYTYRIGTFKPYKISQYRYHLINTFPSFAGGERDGLVVSEITGKLFLNLSSYLKLPKSVLE